LVFQKAIKVFILISLMSANKFVVRFAESLEDFFRSFWVAIAGLVLLGVVWGMGKLGGKIAPSLLTSTSNIAWTVIYFLVLSIVGVFIFSGLIGVAGKVVKKKKSCWDDFFINGKKFWFSNFLVLVLLLILFNGMNLFLLGFRELMIWLSPRFEVSAMMFRNLSYLIAFAYLIVFFVFFSFTQFFVVLKNRSVWGGVKDSWKFVKMNYLETLVLLVVFGVLFKLLSGIGGVVEMIVVYAFGLPYLSLLWTRFVLRK